MKKIFMVSIISLGFVFAVVSQSFALVDGAVWGGYVFKAEMEEMDSIDIDGGNYGIKGHYNTALIPLLELGIGGYYQYSTLQPDVAGADDIKRQTLGLDANLILGLPIIHPYARFTYSLWDKWTVDSESDTKKFGGYGLGAGLELTVAPFVRIFGEYMYDYAKHDVYLKSNSANIGLKLDI